MTAMNIRFGLYGSLVGGAIFGGMMGMMGMLPMIGAMAGVPSAAAGLAVHLVISAVIGVGFVIALAATGREETGGPGDGLAYGFAWWLLGPLTLMPLFMGMGFGVNWTIAAAAAAMPSLVGHLVFGAVLGTTYRWLQAGGRAVSRSGHPTEDLTRA
jgi:hypothetical protein